MPKRILRNGSNLLFKEQKTILSAAVAVSLMSLLAAVLGLVKMRLYAGIVGVGPEFDTFVAAFKLPDFIFSLVVLSALNSAFIPVFIDFIGKKEKAAAWRFASQILNVAVILLSLVSLIIFIFAQPFSVLVAAGFPPAQTRVLIRLMRIMLLSPILLGISSFIGGAIQSFRRFWMPFLAPVVYNLGGILGVLFLYRPLGVDGLAWGVVLGSAFHLLVQIPVLRHLGFKYTFVVDLKDSVLRKTVGLTTPRALGVLGEQTRSLIIISLASVLQSGSISILRFAESIFTVPVSIIGSSIAQASLPTLSRELAQGQKKKFKETLTASFLQILYLIVPVTVVLVFLKIPVVRLVLGIGKFDWAATTLVAWVLALLSLSLPAQAVNHLFVRAFYALKNTKTPVLIGVFSAVFSLAGAAVLMPFYQIKGIALALTLGTLLEVSLLGINLSKSLQLDWKKLLSPVAKILFSGAIMALAIYLPYKVLDQEFLDTQRVVNLLILMWLVLSFGGSVYFILTWVLGLDEVRILIKFMWKLRNLRETLTSVSKLPPTTQAPLTEEGME